MSLGLKQIFSLSKTLALIRRHFLSESFKKTKQNKKQHTPHLKPVLPVAWPTSFCSKPLVWICYSLKKNYEWQRQFHCPQTMLLLFYLNSSHLSLMKTFILRYCWNFCYHFSTHFYGLNEVIKYLVGNSICLEFLIVI